MARWDFYTATWATPDILTAYAGGAANFVSAPKDSWNILTVLWDGANSELWLDGASQGTGDSGSYDLDGITLGAYIDGTYLADIDFAEFILYSGDIGSAARDKVHRYLSAKYGIALS